MNAVDAAEIVTQYWPLAMRFARQWSEKYPHLEDEFKSESAMVLWQSALKYPSVNPPVKLTTWLYHSLHWGLSKRLISESKKNPSAFQRGVTELGDNGEPLDPLALLPAAEKQIDAKVLAEDLVSTLPERYQGLIRRVYLNGEAVRDVAIEAGVTVSCIHQKLRLALRKMAVAGGE